MIFRNNQNEGRGELSRRLFSGGAWSFAGRMAGALAGFAVNMLISRLLPPQEVGAYFLIVSLVMGGIAVAQLGLQIAVVRLVAEALGQGLPGRARAAVVTVLKTGTTSAFVVALAVGVAGMIVVHLWYGASPMLRAGVWYAAAWIVALTALNLLAEAFRGFHDYRLAAVFGGPANNLLLMGVLAVLFFWQGRGSLSTVLMSCVVTVLVVCVLAAAAMRRRIAAMESGMRMEIREVVGIGWPLMITSLSIFFVTQADLWIVGAYRSADEVAVYGAAARLVQLVMMPMLIVNAVLPPLISEMYSQGKTGQLERVIRMMSTMAGIPALAALVMFIVAAEPILGLAYGAYYKSGGMVLILVSLGQAINVMTGSGAVVLMMTGHQRAIMNISVICGVILMLSGMAVAERYGAVGVAAVSAVSVALHAVMTLWWVKRKTGMWTHVGFFRIQSMSFAAAGQHAK